MLGYKAVWRSGSSAWFDSSEPTFITVRAGNVTGDSRPDFHGALYLIHIRIYGVDASHKPRHASSRIAMGYQGEALPGYEEYARFLERVSCDSRCSMIPILVLAVLF